jgi:AraC-like DNA-binding protein
MPFAPRIRKEILQALETRIIPALRRQEVALGNVILPFRFPPGISARLVSKSVPRASADSPGFPVQNHYPKARLHSAFYPYIGFVYEGAAVEHTIVNATQASRYQIQKGIYALHWQAPGVLLFPPGTARNTGLRLFQDDKNRPPSTVKILLCEVTAFGLNIHTLIENNGQRADVSHSLQINDDSVMALSHVFIKELQEATTEDQGIPQAIYLAMMLRLQHHLRAKTLKLANTSCPPTPALNQTLVAEHTHRAWQDAVIFIQINLHENLTLPLIAKQVGFSPAHLSRLFHRFGGMSVMQYVKLQRIAAAKKMLIEQAENITEIAQMVGFASSTVFCSAFRRETRLTPGQFRRQFRSTSSFSKK